jgi:hypothetical protein
MFGQKRTPQGSDGDSVSPRRDKLIIAGLTLALGAALVVSTFRQGGDHHKRILALKARVAQLNAKQAAARKLVDSVDSQYPGDPRVFEASKRAGWLTPDEWGEWYRLQNEIEELGGTTDWEDGSGRPSEGPGSESTKPHSPAGPDQTRSRATTASTFETRE